MGKSLQRLAFLIDRHPFLSRDLWILYRVDVRRVWDGLEEPGWVLGFADLVLSDDRSFTSARINGGAEPSESEAGTGDAPEWVHWLGYTREIQLLTVLVNMQVESKHRLRVPKIREWQPPVIRDIRVVRSDDPMADWAAARFTLDTSGIR